MLCYTCIDVKAVCYELLNLCDVTSNAVRVKMLLYVLYVATFVCLAKALLTYDTQITATVIYMQHVLVQCSAIAVSQVTDMNSFVTTPTLLMHANVLLRNNEQQLRIKNTQGYEDTIVWSPYGDDNMGYKQFVCVESGKVSTPYKLEAGSEAVFKMDLVPGSF